MDTRLIERLRACQSLGHSNVSVEADGTCWTGTEDNKTVIDSALVDAEVVRIEGEKQAAKQALLDRLGITADEARLLLS